MAYEFYLNKRKKEACDVHQRRKHIRNVLTHGWKLAEHFLLKYSFFNEKRSLESKRLIENSTK